MNVNIAPQVNSQLGLGKKFTSEADSLFTIHQYQTFTFNSYL